MTHKTLTPKQREALTYLLELRTWIDPAKLCLHRRTLNNLVAAGYVACREMHTDTGKRVTQYRAVKRPSAPP